MSTDDRLQLVRRSQHLPAADRPPLQLLVVVQEPDNLEIGLPQLMQQVESRFTGARQQQALADPATASPCFFEPARL